MIITETVNINGTDYKKTYSDSGFYIERDGATYCEAIDPLNSGRVYDETTELIEHDEDATAEDYEAALRELGVDV